MPDQDQRIAFLGELHRFYVDFCDQRARGIDHAQLAVKAGIANLRRHAVLAQQQTNHGRVLRTRKLSEQRRAELLGEERWHPDVRLKDRCSGKTVIAASGLCQHRAKALAACWADP